MSYLQKGYLVVVILYHLISDFTSYSIILYHIVPYHILFYSTVLYYVVGLMLQIFKGDLRIVNRIRVP